MGARDHKGSRANPLLPRRDQDGHETEILRATCTASRLLPLAASLPSSDPSIDALTRIARSARSEAIAEERVISTEASDSEQRRNAARGRTGRRFLVLNRDQDDTQEP
jgi:hypothetical protein